MEAEITMDIAGNEVTFMLPVDGKLTLEELRDKAIDHVEELFRKAQISVTYTMTDD